MTSQKLVKVRPKLNLTITLSNRQPSDTPASRLNLSSYGSPTITLGRRAPVVITQPKQTSEAEQKQEPQISSPIVRPSINRRFLSLKKLGVAANVI